jgi:uncharacterized protein YggE
VNSLAERYADRQPMTLSPSQMTQKLPPAQSSGHIASAADRIVLTLHVGASAPEFTDAARILNQKIASLGDEMEKAGIRRADLQTGHYELRETRQVRGPRTVRTGFDVSRRIRLELSLDYALLDRFIAAVTASSARPALSLAFTGQDKGVLRHGALAPAIADARKHAETMVRAAGLSLA